uniref:Uncharacterized protein n=1 Tax=Micromonospora carbonacea TaxID=47853 RepID=A0A7D5YCF6_9ACTN|nr:hypothetical protein HZU44_16580 [Micromonospora carbonacea]
MRCPAVRSVPAVVAVASRRPGAAPASPGTPRRGRRAGLLLAAVGAGVVTAALFSSPDSASEDPRVVVAREDAAQASPTRGDAPAPAAGARRAVAQGALAGEAVGSRPVGPATVPLSRRPRCTAGPRR